MNQSCRTEQLCNGQSPRDTVIADDTFLNMHRRHSILFFVTFVLTVASQTTTKADSIVSFKRGKATVNLDINEVPELKEWGTNAAGLALEWHPRICNLLATKDVTPPKTVTLRIIKSEKGIASTQGTTITVSSHWIEKHPEDIGLVIHELVHVIQGYPDGTPFWITEGIADYIRRAIFEGQPQDFFPIPRQDNAYLQGYNTAAGFLFWLESDRGPGIVKSLNSMARNGEYKDTLFVEKTGQPLEALWSEYAKEHSSNR
ncbi:Plant Basic Secretory Protein [Planctomycetes bacterium CA13]|uniref:Plant Basic Secretory Protein n=1 Tax=Novipirellula herctigrandis TaxID=2527986 RepID=A0A5C5YXK5_9BACT|nr:Plant Basic Secretory Protein [Planctomycetes bacterium CA13]